MGLDLFARCAVSGGSRVSLAHVGAALGVPVIVGSRIVINARGRVDPDDSVGRAARAGRQFGGVFARPRRCACAGARRRRGSRGRRRVVIDNLHKQDLSSKSSRCPLETVLHHLLAFLPERLGIFWVERIAPHALADRSDGRLIGNDMSDVAVLAVARADLLRRSDDGRPDGRRSGRVCGVYRSLRRSSRAPC